MANYKDRRKLRGQYGESYVGTSNGGGYQPSSGGGSGWGTVGKLATGALGTGLAYYGIKRGMFDPYFNPETVYHLKDANNPELGYETPNLIQRQFMSLKPTQGVNYETGQPLTQEEILANWKYNQENPIKSPTEYFNNLRNKFSSGYDATVAPYLHPSINKGLKQAGDIAYNLTGGAIANLAYYGDKAKDQFGRIWDDVYKRWVTPGNPLVPRNLSEDIDNIKKAKTQVLNGPKTNLVEAAIKGPEALPQQPGDAGTPPVATTTPPTNPPAAGSTTTPPAPGAPPAPPAPTTPPPGAAPSTPPVVPPQAPAPTVQPQGPAPRDLSMFGQPSGTNPSTTPVAPTVVPNPTTVNKGGYYGASVPRYDIGGYLGAGASTLGAGILGTYGANEFMRRRPVTGAIGSVGALGLGALAGGLGYSQWKRNTPLKLQLEQLERDAMKGSEEDQKSLSSFRNSSKSSESGFNPDGTDEWYEVPIKEGGTKLLHANTLRNLNKGYVQLGDKAYSPVFTDEAFNNLASPDFDINKFNKVPYEQYYGGNQMQRQVPQTMVDASSGELDAPDLNPPALAYGGQVQRYANGGYVPAYIWGEGGKRENETWGRIFDSLYSSTPYAHTKRWGDEKQKVKVGGKVRERIKMGGSGGAFEPTRTLEPIIRNKIDPATNLPIPIMDAGKQKLDANGNPLWETEEAMEEQNDWGGAFSPWNLVKAFALNPKMVGGAGLIGAGLYNSYNPNNLFGRAINRTMHWAGEGIKNEKPFSWDDKWKQGAIPRWATYPALAALGLTGGLLASDRVMSNVADTARLIGRAGKMALYNPIANYLDRRSKAKALALAEKKYNDEQEKLKAVNAVAATGPGATPPAGATNAQLLQNPTEPASIATQRFSGALPPQFDSYLRKQAMPTEGTQFTPAGVDLTKSLAEASRTSLAHGGMVPRYEGGGFGPWAAEHGLAYGLPIGIGGVAGAIGLPFGIHHLKRGNLIRGGLGVGIGGLGSIVSGGAIAKGAKSLWDYYHQQPGAQVPPPGEGNPPSANVLKGDTNEEREQDAKNRLQQIADENAGNQRDIAAEALQDQREVEAQIAERRNPQSRYYIPLGTKPKLINLGGTTIRQQDSYGAKYGGFTQPEIDEMSRLTAPWAELYGQKDPEDTLPGYSENPSIKRSLLERDFMNHKHLRHMDPDEWLRLGRKDYSGYFNPPENETIWQGDMFNRNPIRVMPKLSSSVLRKPLDGNAMRIHVGPKASETPVLPPRQYKFGDKILDEKQVEHLRQINSRWKADHGNHTNAEAIKMVNMLGPNLPQETWDDIGKGLFDKYLINQEINSEMNGGQVQRYADGGTAVRAGANGFWSAVGELLNSMGKRKNMQGAQGTGTESSYAPIDLLRGMYDTGMHRVLGGALSGAGNIMMSMGGGGNEGYGYAQQNAYGQNNGYAANNAYGNPNPQPQQNANGQGGQQPQARYLPSGEKENYGGTIGRSIGGIAGSLTSVVTNPLGLIGGWLGMGRGPQQSELTNNLKELGGTIGNWVGEGGVGETIDALGSWAKNGGLGQTLDSIADFGRGIKDWWNKPSPGQQQQPSQQAQVPDPSVNNSDQSNVPNPPGGANADKTPVPKQENLMANNNPNGGVGAAAENLDNVLNANPEPPTNPSDEVQNSAYGSMIPRYRYGYGFMPRYGDGGWGYRRRGRSPYQRSLYMTPIGAGLGSLAGSIYARQKQAAEIRDLLLEQQETGIDMSQKIKDLKAQGIDYGMPTLTGGLIGAGLGAGIGGYGDLMIN